MRVFYNRTFERFVKRTEITDRDLLEAISRAERGLIDADLGGGIVKQRIARPGSGKSSGFRTIIAMQMKTRAIFLYGFAKRDRENISSQELRALKMLASKLLTYTNEELEAPLALGILFEVSNA